jgi:hypothetical protein
MIKDVKEICPELQRLGLGDGHVLGQTEVPVSKTWAVKETPAGVSELTERFRTEPRSVEIRLARTRIG